MSKLTKEQLFKMAEEMYYRDGVYYSESYSTVRWQEKGWPEPDSSLIYKILDSQIKALRTFDEYQGEEQREPLGRTDILGRPIKKL